MDDADRTALAEKARRAKLDKKRAYRSEHKDAINARRRWLYNNDQEYHDRTVARHREYTSRPEYKERRNANKRERYANDPEYREHIKQKHKEYYERKKKACSCGA